MPEATVARMRERLAALAPIELTIDDDSAQHAGHPGAAGGGGHYTLRLTSPRFEGRSSVERHRLVYDALADLMQREIHALAMVLLAPGETDRRAGAPYPDHNPGK
jgi:BolA protein